MDILFDQNVNSKYVSALVQIDGVSVRTVKDALNPETSDADIASRARVNGWVVFTNDDDFFVHSSDIGLLYYSQVEDHRRATSPRQFGRSRLSTRTRRTSSRRFLAIGSETTIEHLY